MKLRKIIKWAAVLLVTAGCLYVLIAWTSADRQLKAKREATRLAEQTVFAVTHIARTQAAQTVAAAFTDLAAACRSDEKVYVKVEGTISPGILIQTTGNGYIDGFFLHSGDQNAALLSVEVCRDKHYESCLRMLQKGFKDEDMTGFNADGKQFVYGDLVTVSGFAEGYDGNGFRGCTIEVDSIE